eukprot:SAG31_NODE_44_length_31168_cov_16.507290_21_plen_98_part_00
MIYPAAARRAGTIELNLESTTNLAADELLLSDPNRLPSASCRLRQSLLKPCSTAPASRQNGPGMQKNKLFQTKFKLRCGSAATLLVVDSSKFLVPKA